MPTNDTVQIPPQLDKLVDVIDIDLARK